MWYVYILKSQKDLKLYIGSTNDLRKRLRDHNDGKQFATKYRRPLKLIYYEAYEFEYLARRREKRLKYFGSAYRELKKRLRDKK
jgi:putative endonuclease